MKQLEEQLDKIDGYLMSMERNFMEGRYELKVGIPAKWVFKSTKFIACDELGKSDEGTLVKIYANKDNIVVDDLIEFVNIIIETNQQIAKMQEEHKKQQEETVKKMEESELAFGEQIESLTETSFEKMKQKQKEIGEEIGEEPKEDLKAEVEETLSR